MLWLPVDAHSPDAATLARAAAAVASGQVVAFPTDTLYGLAVDPRSASAVAALFDIKGRSPGSAMPLVAASRADVERALGPLTPAGVRLADRFWPGPLSLVVRAPDDLAPAVHAGLRTVAIRVPAHAVARGLAAALGYPVTATSANRSGEPAAATADEVALQLGRVAVLLDAGATPGGAPSTIVDVTGSEVRLVRPGAVPWERVLESIR